MMKLDSSTPPEMNHELLMRSARDVYGDQRAGELSDQLEHLAKMMTGVARQELEIREEPLPGPAERGAR